MDDIEKRLDAARPSGDPTFADRVQRMIQPEALKQQKPWLWSPGIGTDVWAMFCACIDRRPRDREALWSADPSLVRAHYEYRTPLSFAVRENQLAVAEFLLDHGADAARARRRARDRARPWLRRRWRACSSGSSRACTAPRPRASRSPRPSATRDLDACVACSTTSPELLHAGDGRSNQPIHWAVMTRQLDIIDELLARGADINARRVGRRAADPSHERRLSLSRLARCARDGHHHAGRCLSHTSSRAARDVDIGMAAATGDIAARARAARAEIPAREPSCLTTTRTTSAAARRSRTPRAAGTSRS